MISSKKIALFKNLAQFDLGENYYDFHNDFNCIKISFENSSLILLFQNVTEPFIVSFAFQEVLLEKFEFSNFSGLHNLTIDNLYRGRFEENHMLKEFSTKGKAYFYLEFYEGQKMEFWSNGINVEKLLCSA